MIVSPENLWFHIESSTFGANWISENTSKLDLEAFKEKIHKTANLKDPILTQALEYSLCEIKLDALSREPFINPSYNSIRHIKSNKQLHYIPEFLNAIMERAGENQTHYICTETISDNTLIICHLGIQGTHIIEVDKKVATKEKINTMLAENLEHFYGTDLCNELARTCLVLFICKTTYKYNVSLLKMALQELNMQANYFIQVEQKSTH
ncbi:hypothetical protein [Pseudoalteromonas marina]|uniref:Uncharacterized protein n=1 Tax=Pseudoalteromonas marina TaxID=267375 RepID=A0ABT9FIF1_9GAMM|nr:hypothetical protein [Pseudoalteromonas marina]MDP2566390.1 hypothetical protein [Pseudoalteromonas marina]